ncbi:MAG: hypothetical protein CVV17_01615 [Gammaproteobacteria bacterium HGW-Gammaproteobacteria-7]|nr:MAG: hypothetical protein CVV17_01615 [Gammaproteobacteria bacterium HGW-Gammaproteobacteria-7]
MSRHTRWHWFGKGLLALVLLAVLLVASVFALRLIIPTEGDRSALAWLSQLPEPPTGSSGFAALWALPYDLPAEAIAPLVAEDVRRAGELVGYVPVAGTGDDTPSGAPKSPFTSALNAHGTAFAPAPITSRCGEPQDCFAAARSDPAGFRALLSADPTLPERTLALAGHEALRDAFPYTVWGPSLANRYNLLLSALPMSLGLRAAEVGPLAGITESCRQLDGWRRFAAQPVTLLQRMLDIAVVRRLADIAARLLAELPTDTELPADCRTAFAAPTPAEGDFCAVLPFEFQYAQAMLAHMQAQTAEAAAQASAPVRYLHGLLVDDELGRLWRARSHQVLCDAARTTAATDAPIDVDALTATYELPAHECAAAWLTCTLESTAAPAYVQYIDRQIDHAARLRLLAAALWLRDNADPAQPLAERLSHLPDPLRGHATRNLRVGEDGESLLLDLHQVQPDRIWSIPVAAAGQSAQGAAQASTDQAVGLRL